MSSTRSTSTNLTALQKAAVLINSLDMRTADALLDQMPAEQAARVRETLLELDDIPAEVQDEVIAEFLRNGGRLPAPAPQEADDVELELSEEAVASSPPAAEPTPSPTAPFEFLRDASPSLLADFLRQEHPQTAAVVLAHLEPDHAARVLERLPAELSTESLARMARLHQVSPDILADLEAELRAQLLPRIEAERRPVGLAGASAVLSALNDPLRKQMLGQLAHRDQALVRQLGYLDAASERWHAARMNSVAQTQAARLSPAPPPKPVPPKSPSIRFTQLNDLNDATLQRIVAEADPEVLLLALTDADDRFVQRVLKQLHAVDAAVLRQRLQNPGPLRLSDVSAAQRQLAELAVELHDLAIIQIPFLPTQHLSLQS